MKHEISNIFGILIFLIYLLLFILIGKMIAWVLSRFYVPNENAILKRRKDLVITVGLATIVISVLFMVFQRPTMLELGPIAIMFVLISTCVIIIHCYFTKELPETHIEILLTIYIVGTMMTDIYASSYMSPKVWPICLLVLDVSVVCRLPKQFCRFGAGLVVVYLVSDMLESRYRFGLYDMPGTAQMSNRIESLHCIGFGQSKDLSGLPCSVNSVQFNIYSMFICMVILHQSFIESFSNSVTNEKLKLQKSIVLAETVVSELIRLDLENATSWIETDAENPLAGVLSQLIGNLHDYRPYIPDSLFDIHTGEGDIVSTRQDVPGITSGIATIVFTDIKSSTFTWEASPDAMKRALRIHNLIIRKAISQFYGYEVKTIGDSFMVAFETMLQGCRFGMAVQQGLQVANWPTDLRVPDEHQQEGWTGLMARIGICCGEVEVEYNDLWGRSDYFGRTVNKAARLEGVGIPGAVTICASQLYLIEGEDWHINHLRREMKGIPETDIAVLRRNSNGQSLLICSCPSTTGSSDASSDNMNLCPQASIDFGSMNLKAKRRHLTVAKVSQFSELEDPLNEVNQWISQVIQLMERTEGTVTAVFGANLIIGWNTVRQVLEHLEKSLRFCSFIQNVLENHFTMGICYGRAICGMVGTNTQKFVTIIGSCVNVSVRLCQAAYDMGVPALVNKSDPQYKRLFRPVDIWDDGMQVNQLRVAALKAFFLRKVGDPVVQDDDWGWSEAYSEAFFKGDSQAIGNECLPSDTILQKVASMVSCRSDQWHSNIQKSDESTSVSMNSSAWLTDYIAVSSLPKLCNR